MVATAVMGVLTHYNTVATAVMATITLQHIQSLVSQ